LFNKKNWTEPAGHSGSVILSTLEVEIRRIVARGQPRQRDSFSTKEAGVVACACHPSYAWSINSRITAQVSLGINGRPLLEKHLKQKKQKKKRAGLIGRVLQVQGPEFKPQYHLKKNWTENKYLTYKFEILLGVWISEFVNKITHKKTQLTLTRDLAEGEEREADVLR
jgi:hypothetical protein